MTGPLLPGQSQSNQTVGTHAEITPLAAVGTGGLLPDVPTQEPGANQIARAVAAIRRFLWLVILMTGAGTAAAVLFTRTQSPEYTAGATIYISTDQNQSGGPIQAPELLSSFNWMELIKTYAVLDPVVEEMRRYLLAEKAPAHLFDGFELSDRFLPGDYILTVDDAGQRYEVKNRSAGNLLSSGAVEDSVGRELGFRWVPGSARLTAGLEVRFRVLHPRDAAAALRDQLFVSMSQEKGNFLQMSLTGTDPNEIAGTINAVQRQFVSVAADLKKRKLSELSKLLADQVQQQETKLRQAEQALESFRVATITQPKEDVPVASGLQQTSASAYGRYFDQRVQIETMRNERRGIEDVLRRLADGDITVDAFQTIPAVRGAPDLGRALSDLSTTEAELRALRSKYTDESKNVKDLQAKIASLKQTTIPAYATALVRQLKIQEGELEGRLNSASQELKGIPVRTITEGRLLREMESARVLFVNLQNRYEETKLAEISAIPDVKILDEARPPTSPSKNQASRIILMGFMASLGASLGLAILLDRLDKRFRYPEQVSHELGLAILGAIPAVPKARDGRSAPSEEMAQVVEAFRSVRLNLAHSFEPGSTICITISSPSPGDGKSLIAANLALSFAEAGYRTALVDGDTRRGDLHRTFGADRRPGLLDYLATAGLAPERVFRPTSHRNLTLIPSGVRLQHGPELLGSARMAELVSLLKGRFEVVLIDSPPLGAGIDPFVLGTHSANMLLVLRSGETDRQMAEVKLRILDRLPVRVLGAVLNHIHAGAGAYKYYAYSYGYAAEDEGSISEGSSRALPEGAGAPEA